MCGERGGVVCVEAAEGRTCQRAGRRSRVQQCGRGGWAVWGAGWVVVEEKREQTEDSKQSRVEGDQRRSLRGGCRVWCVCGATIFSVTKGDSLTDLERDSPW